MPRWPHHVKRSPVAVPWNLTYKCVTEIFRFSRRLLQSVVSFSRTGLHHGMFCEMRAPSVCASKPWCRMRSFFDDHQRVHLLHTASAMEAKPLSGREQSNEYKKLKAGLDLRLARAREKWVNSYINDGGVPEYMMLKNLSHPMLFHAYKWASAVPIDAAKLTFHHDAAVNGSFGAALLATITGRRRLLISRAPAAQ